MYWILLIKCCNPEGNICISFMVKRTFIKLAIVVTANNLSNDWNIDVFTPVNSWSSSVDNWRVDDMQLDSPKI